MRRMFWLAKAHAFMPPTVTFGDSNTCVLEGWQWPRWIRHPHARTPCSAARRLWRHRCRCHV